MAVFNDQQDRQTVRSLALTFAGFTALMVCLILIAYFLTY